MTYAKENIFIFALDFSGGNAEGVSRRTTGKRYLHAQAVHCSVCAPAVTENYTVNILVSQIVFGNKRGDFCGDFTKIFIAGKDYFFVRSNVHIITAVAEAFPLSGYAKASAENIFTITAAE